MTTVLLAYATRESRQISRAIANAANDVKNRAGVPQFRQPMQLVIRANVETLSAINQTDELRGAVEGGYLLGLAVQVDNRVPPHQLIVEEPRSQIHEVIEVF